jgi:hypothetical protein
MAKKSTQTALINARCILPPDTSGILMADVELSNPDRVTVVRCAAFMVETVHDP